MAARYYSEFPDRKLKDAGKYKQNGGGSPVSMTEKPAFPGASVPGKTQAGGRSNGTPKC